MFTGWLLSVFSFMALCGVALMFTNPSDAYKLIVYKAISVAFQKVSKTVELLKNKIGDDFMV